MGSMANIPATVTEFSVLVIGIRDCSSSIVDFVVEKNRRESSIDSVSHLCPGH